MVHIKLKDLISESHKLDEGFLDIFRKIFPSRNTQDFTPKQRKILYDYTKAGYHDINRHLRNKYGEKDLIPDYKKENPDPYQIEDKIGLISSAFTKENTNRSKVVVYTGVVPEFEKKVASNISKTMNFSGFTSTSADRGVALNFGEFYADNRNDIHILKCVCPPHTVLDIKSVSKNPREEEYLINYGAKFKVIKQRMDTKTYPNTNIYETEIQLLGEQVYSK